MIHAWRQMGHCVVARLGYSAYASKGVLVRLIILLRWLSPNLGSMLSEIFH